MLDEHVSTPVAQKVIVPENIRQYARRVEVPLTAQQREQVTAGYADVVRMIRADGVTILDPYWSINLSCGEDGAYSMHIALIPFGEDEPLYVVYSFQNGDGTMWSMDPIPLALE